jgi:hypothetical protein
MPNARRRSVTRALAALVPLALIVPAHAQAQAPVSGCDATALRLSLLGGTPVAPITANVGQADCQTAHQSLLDLPGGLPASLPLTATVAEARTERTSVAAARARITGLDVGTGGVLEPLLTPVRQQLATALDGAAIDLTALELLLNTLTLGQAGDLTVDVQTLADTLADNLGAQVAPSLVGAELLTAEAEARCVNGSAALSGRSQILGLSVLGTEIDANPALRQVTYIDAQHLDLGETLDIQNLLDGIYVEGLGKSLQDVIDDLGLAGATVNQITGLLDGAVEGVPPIEVPEQVLEARVTPDGQTSQPGSLTRTALHIELGVLGQDLVDLVLAEARVAASSVDCGQPTTPDDPGPSDPPLRGVRPGDGAIVDEALRCTTRRLVLIDVLRRGNRVRLVGAADRRYAGRRVRIRLLAGGKTVARPKVAPSGLFQASAKLPPRSIRNTGRARYQAAIGRERSLALKLVRRLVVTRTSARNGRVTIQGVVVRPHARPARAIVVKRRVSCERWRTVARVQPRTGGRFRITLRAPREGQAAVIRLETRVPGSRSQSRLYPTFTLPRYVSSGRVL